MRTGSTLLRLQTTMRAANIKDKNPGVSAATWLGADLENHTDSGLFWPTDAWDGVVMWR